MMMTMCWRATCVLIQLVGLCLYTVLLMINQLMVIMRDLVTHAKQQQMQNQHLRIVHVVYLEDLVVSAAVAASRTLSVPSPERATYCRS